MNGYCVPGHVNFITCPDVHTGVVATADGIAIVVGGKGLEIRGMDPNDQRELAGALSAIAKLRDEQQMGVVGHA
jgi:hypothetical protein